MRYWGKDIRAIMGADIDRGLIRNCLTKERIYNNIKKTEDKKFILKA